MAHDDHTPQGLLDGNERISHVELRGAEAEDNSALPRGALAKLWSAMAACALLVGASYLFDWTWAQPWRSDEDYVPYWNVVARELLGHGVAAEAQEEELAKFEALARTEHEPQGPLPDREATVLPGDEPRTYPAYTAHETDPAAPERSFENEEALEEFYAALSRTDIGLEGAITRVGHWGDSVLGNDGITAAIRGHMQTRFGDAGHGFHALTQYDPSYKHKGVRFEVTGRWGRCYVMRKCQEDHRYGYGGTIVWSAGGGESLFATADTGAFGRKVSRFELWYAKRGNGGNVRVRFDDARSEVVATGLPDEDAAPVDAWASFELEDAPHRIEVRAIGGGRVEAYGVVLEREGPGVVWDGMALIGSHTDRLNDPEDAHWAGQLAHRDLDLIVLMFGGNDMWRGEKGDLRRNMVPYEDQYRRAIARMRAAKPDASCLIMSPIDHGTRTDGGQIVTRDVVPRMVAAQRKVALEQGCAFFDTFEAMGGSGSIARWRRAYPRLASPDLSHPTKHGHRVIGQLFYQALFDGYVKFRRRVEGQELPGLAAK